jgi:hypothetical protein
VLDEAQVIVLGHGCTRVWGEGHRCWRVTWRQDGGGSGHVKEGLWRAVGELWVGSAGVPSFRGAAGRFDSGGGGQLWPLLNGIGNRDVAVTGCVGVVGRDVAGAGDGGGMKTVRQGVVWDRVRGSVDVPASLSGRGGSS